MTLSWVRAVDISILPLLAFTLYVCDHFAQLRKKRGYKVVGIGTLLIAASVSMNFLLRQTSFEKQSWSGLIGHLIQGFDVTGRYIALIGLIFLHRIVPQKARWTLMGIMIVFFAVGFLPGWLFGLLTGLISIAASFLIQKWIGFSRKSLLVVLWLFALKDLSIFIEWILRKDFELIRALSGVGIASFILGIVVNRVSDVLDTSYRSSITDALTGLYNRRYFSGWVNKYVERGIQVSVVFFDLDNFKKVNDTMGHDKGDEALKIVAGILNEEVDGSGIAGRYGGEEMVILITKEGTDMEAFCERVRLRIEAECITTASIGFATAFRGITADELVKRADEAMYFSKTNGKNRVTGYKN